MMQSDIEPCQTDMRGHAHGPFCSPWIEAFRKLNSVDHMTPEWWAEKWHEWGGERVGRWEIEAARLQKIWARERE